MPHPRLRIPLIFLLTLALTPAAVFTAAAQDEETSEYTAQTTKDPEIPEDELALLVKPLTKSELIVEADAWQVLVQAKVRQLTAAEIAVKRKNQEISAAKETADALEDVGKAIEKAAETPAKDLEKVTEKAEEASRRVQEATQQSAEARDRTEQDEDVRAAVEDSEQRARDADGDAQPSEPVAPAATVEVSDEDLQDVNRIREKAESASQAAEVTTDQKKGLLETVNDIRDERTELIDRARVVLKELDLKGDSSGADTEEHRAYLVAVSGATVDASDWDALLATAIGWIKSEQGGLRWALNVANFVALVGGFWILSLFVGRVADRALKTRYTRKLSTLMRAFLAKIIRRAVLVVGFVVALTALEINTGPLLAAIGAAGFVVAFALQDSLSNFASGIMILMYRPFDVGDVVETGGVSGKVTALNLVSVMISTFDNKIVLVPNNKVWNDVITNATGVRQRRVDMTFGIGYDDDMAKAQSVLERVVDQHELVLKDPAPVIKVHELGDSSVNFICRPWVKTDDYWNVYWDITRGVKEAFDQEGISIPFPQRDVHMYHANAPVPAGEERE